MTSLTSNKKQFIIHVSQIKYPTLGKYGLLIRFS